MAARESYQRYRDPKTCFVPTCSKTDKENPGLRFFTVRKELKENWCQLASRNCPKRTLYCCEEHLNFEEDLENYNQWVAGAKPRLKLNATLKNYLKERDENVRVLKQASTSGSSVVNVQDIRTVNASVQCRIPMPSKSIMVKPTTKNQGTNFRARKINNVMPSQMPNIICDVEESPCQSPSIFGSSNFDSSASSGPKNDDDKSSRKQLLKKIADKPKMYLGLPKCYWWIVQYLAQETSSIALHIIMTLFKLKNNDSFERMSDEFEMARSTIRNIFEKNVVALATYLQNIIYLPPIAIIKRNLPLVFKIRYSNVQCIIDCFEIQIEKPSDPNHQAQAWSQYKSCNTMKYLIACTPAGFVAFVSQGFGGRISDKAITERSGFIDILPVNAVIMADRGFKEIEAALSIKNIKLLRPPSVYSNQKMTKQEVIQTKVIASLRVHVERVIRRVREFHMLKPHAVVNNKHIKYLDELVTIACGLINLQDPIIKDS